MGGFNLEVDAPRVLYTTQTEADHQAQLGQKCISNYSLGDKS